MIQRQQWPAASGKRVNLYVGSGLMGACFGGSGLMDATSDPNAVRVGETVLMHAAHWHRGVFGIDQQVPLARIHWDGAIAEVPERWSQQLDTAHGLLTTSVRRGGCDATVQVTCHPQARDFMGFAFEGKHIPEVWIAPVRHWTTCYDETLGAPEPAPWAFDGHWLARLRLGTADSALAVRIQGAATAKAQGGRLRVSFGTGPARLIIGVSAWPDRDSLKAGVPRGDFFRSAARAWKQRWGGVSFDDPDPRLASLGRRSIYHLLCSYAPEPSCPPPPMGWTGNAWGHHFPQDVSYIHPALLRLGLHDIAKGMVEFYASRIQQMEEATRRIYDLPGTMWAWEFPIGADTRILPDGQAPNPFQYEIHNAAYPARMAWETGQATGDKAWARAVALPVILGSAAFFTAALQRGRDGLWGIHLKPSMGQDEFGGENAPDYLCALFAACYTLRTALKIVSWLRLRHSDAARWQRILADGLAFPRLLDKRAGVYATSALKGWKLQRQKHPIQLSPYIFLPQPLDGPTRRAYQIRQRLCANDRPSLRHPGTGGSFYDGWSLFAYALACAKAHDPLAMRETLAELEIAQLTDHEHIQIYESSGFWKPYYTTSMGLLLQALLPKA
jgi:hypothetical protein